MIQRNLRLISAKRNEITTLCSVRNHFLTDGLKTMQAYMKSNCTAAGSTIMPWMMIIQPFCNAWDIAEFQNKSHKDHDSAKNRKPLFKKSCAAAALSFAYLSRAKQKLQSKLQPEDWKELRTSDQLPFSWNLAFEEIPREQPWQHSKAQTHCQIFSRSNLDRVVTIKSNIITYTKELRLAASYTLTFRDIHRESASTWQEGSGWKRKHIPIYSNFREISKTQF